MIGNETMISSSMHACTPGPEDPIFARGQEREMVELSKQEKINHTPIRFYTRSISIPRLYCHPLGDNKSQHMHVRDMNLVNTTSSIIFA